MVDWQAEKTELLFWAQDSFITCFFSSPALILFPRVDHSSKEAAEAGLLEPTQLNSKASDRII